MRSLTLIAVSLTLVVVPLAACGKDSGSSGSSDTAKLAPATSIVYVEANTDDGGAVDQLVAKFPGGGGGGGTISALIEKALKEDDAPISYEKDVEPWLGDQIGFFVNGRLTADGDVQDAAAIVATTDEDAAMATVEKAAEGKAKDASYKEHDYKTFDDDGGDPGAAGIVDGALVIGTVSGFKAAVDAAEGEGLQDSDTYEQALEGAAEDRIGLAYFDTKAFYDMAATQPGAQSLRSFEDAFDQPYVVTLDADGDGVELAATISEAGLGKLVPFLGEGTDLVDSVPADSWLAFGQPELGKTIDSVIDVAAEQVGGRAQLERQLSLATGMTLDELTGWMGDFAVYVKGTSVADLSGALIIETTDEAQSGKVLAKLAQLASAAADGAKVTRSGDGFTITAPNVPAPIHVLQQDGRVIVAYGDEAAQEAAGGGETLADSPGYKDATAALGDDYSIATWLSIPQILQLVDSTPASGEPDWTQIKPYLEPLGAIVSAAKADGDKVSSVLRVTVP